MRRREFLAATGGCLGMTLTGGAAESKNMIIELRTLKLRNTQDGMPQRTSDFLSKGLAGGLQRAGVSQIGAFTSLIGPDSPFVLLVTQYPSLSAWDTMIQSLMADKEFLKHQQAYNAGPLGYTRMEVTLLRGFDTIPGIEKHPPLPERRSRIFELRTYESNNLQTLQRKIRMFDEGEIAVFRKVNILPVFFGATIAGRNMPNLTYMVAYDDLAAREKAWTAFGSHPEWVKMRSEPGVSDGEIVSNISNSIVRPLPFSTIR